MVTSRNLNLNNDLHSNKFKLVFDDVKSVELLCTGASIPGIDATPQEIPNSRNRIFAQGTKVNFAPLTLTFKVDENLIAYKEIYNWMIGIHHPTKADQYKKFQENLKLVNKAKGAKFGFDATLITLKNSGLPNINLRFHTIFPVSLSSIDFTYTSGSEHIVASAQFQYDYYVFDD